MLSEQDKQDRIKWAEALESGEYEQGQNRLHDFVENTYCCLGVAEKIGLCKVRDARYSVHPFASFNDHDLYNFVVLNDERGYSFEQIAEVIRSSIKEKEVTC